MGRGKGVRDEVGRGKGVRDEVGRGKVLGTRWGSEKGYKLL